MSVHSTDAFSSANIKKIVIFLQWRLPGPSVQSHFDMLYIPCVNSCEPKTSKPLEVLPSYTFPLDRHKKTK